MVSGESTKAQGVARQGLMTQVLVFLVFLSWIKQLGFKSGDPQPFEELIQVFSLALVVVSQPLVSSFFLFSGLAARGFLGPFPFSRW